MGTAECWLILILLNHAVMSRAVPADDYILPGQTHPDDPNACFWFYWQDGNSIFRCCNGTKKSDSSNITEKCTECQDGSYGNNCERNCTCQHDGICNKANGSCSCINNYFGNNCQYPCNCENEGTCLPDGSCICSNRFYGEQCQSSCECPVDRKCHGKTKECICPDGYYDSCSLHKYSGDSTNDPLNWNCTYNPDDRYNITSCFPCNCSDNGRCDPLTGRCTCNPGYHGEHCVKQCSCYNGAVCSDAYSACKCAYGWKGPNCTDCDLERDAQSEQLFCADKCFHCYNGDACRVPNGDCLCTPGWLGNRCDQQCDEGFYGYNCSKQCECENGLCDHVNGFCQCHEGWIGHHCEHRCPEHCVTCKDDLCLSCKPGWIGGHCNRTCKDGYYGDSCKQECLPCNCTHSCNNTDGSCLDVVSCHDHNCTCKNGVRCFANTSYCECQDGWSGPHCDVENTAVTEEGTSASMLSSSSTIENIDYGLSSNDKQRTTAFFIVIISCCLTIFVGIICATVCVVLRMKRKHKRMHHESTENGQPTTATQLPRQRETSNVVQYPCHETLSMEISTDGNNACSISDRQTYHTNLDHGSDSQTTDEEINSEHSFNSNQRKRLITRTKSRNLNIDARKKSAFEGPYSIVPIFDPDSDSDTANTGYDILDGLVYKKKQRRRMLGHRDYEGINCNLDTGDHNYEVLQHSYKFDNRDSS